MGSEPCVLSINLTSTHLPGNLYYHLAKSGFVKTFVQYFAYYNSQLFLLPFYNVPPISKLVSRFTCIRLAACRTDKEVDRALLIAV